MRLLPLLLLNYATVSRAAKGMRCKRIGFGLRGFESLPVALTLLLSACSVYQAPQECSRELGEGVRVCLYQLAPDEAEADAGGCE